MSLSQVTLKVDHSCLWPPSPGGRYKLRLPQGKESTSFYWTHTNNASIVHSGQFPVNGQPGAFLWFGWKQDKADLLQEKLHYRTSWIHFIFSVMPSGGGRYLLWDTCVVPRTVNDRGKPRGSCHTTSSQESMGRRRQLFQQEYLHSC